MGVIGVILRLNAHWPSLVTSFGLSGEFGSETARHITFQMIGSYGSSWCHSTGHIGSRAQLKDFNLFHAPWQIEKKDAGEDLRRRGEGG